MTLFKVWCIQDSGLVKVWFRQFSLHLILLWKLVIFCSLYIEIHKVFLATKQNSRLNDYPEFIYVYFYLLIQTILLVISDKGCTQTRKRPAE